MAKAILTQEHDTILSKFPPNLSPTQVKEFIRTRYIPFLQQRVFPPDGQPQYPALLRRQSAIDNFTNTLATLYQLRQQHRVEVIPNVNLLKEISADGFCHTCGNLVTESQTGKTFCNLFLRRHKIKLD